jgi:cardiolipin synthase
MFTVILSVLGTLVVVFLIANFKTPEKEPHHKVQHLFAITDPPMKREMGALLGPAIVAGNCVPSARPTSICVRSSSTTRLA